MNKFGAVMDEKTAVQLMTVLARAGSQRAAAKELKLGQSTFSGRFNKALLLLGIHRTTQLLSGSPALEHLPWVVNKNLAAKPNHRAGLNPHVPGKATISVKAAASTKASASSATGVKVNGKACTKSDVKTDVKTDVKPKVTLNKAKASTVAVKPDSFKDTMAALSQVKGLGPIPVPLVKYTAKVTHAKSLLDLRKSIEAIDERFLIKICQDILGKPVTPHWEPSFIQGVIGSCEKALDRAQAKVH